MKKFDLVEIMATHALKEKKNSHSDGNYTWKFNMY